MLVSKLKIGILLMTIAVISAMAFPTENTINITIISPTDNAEIKMGDTVQIKANISSESALHDVSIKVTSADNMLVLYNENIHTHSNQQIIDRTYIQTIKYRTELILEISTRDHSGKMTATNVQKFYSEKK